MDNNSQNSEEIKKSLTSNIKSGVIWNSFLAMGRQGLNFIATIILARLLTPEDYGLLGMMAIFISVSEVLMEAGLGAALIKKQNVSNIDYSTLATYNVFISIVLYASIFFLSPYIGKFYSMPSLIEYTRIFALVILIDSFSIVPKVQLMKDLQFKKLSLINIASGLCGLLCAIILALFNLGVYSLIFQYIITSFFLTLSLVICTKYRPFFHFSLISFKQMIGFGLNTTGANILKSSTENLFVNAAAKICPITTAGFFNQSYKLQNVLTSVCNTVIDGALFPVLSKETDGNIVRHSTWLNYFSMTFLSFVVFLLIINVDTVVLLFLGEKWMGTVPFLKVFILVGLVQTYTSLNRNLLKSLGITLDILFFELMASVACLTFMIIFGRDINYLLLLLLLYAVLRFILSLLALHYRKIVKIAESAKISLKATIPSLLPFVICVLLLKVGFVKSVVILNLIYLLSFSLITQLMGFHLISFIKKVLNDK